MVSHKVVLALCRISKKDAIIADALTMAAEAKTIANTKRTINRKKKKNIIAILNLTSSKLTKLWMKVSKAIPKTEITMIWVFERALLMSIETVEKRNNGKYRTESRFTAISFNAFIRITSLSLLHIL